MSDIITDIIHELQIISAAITPEQAQTVERVIRLKWGGEVAYVLKGRLEVNHKRKIINDELRAGRSIAQIEQLHDIPRRTIYRLINHKRQQRG